MEQDISYEFDQEYFDSLETFGNPEASLSYDRNTFYFYYDDSEMFNIVNPKFEITSAVSKDDLIQIFEDEMPAAVHLEGLYFDPEFTQPVPDTFEGVDRDINFFANVTVNPAARVVLHSYVMHVYSQFLRDHLTAKEIEIYGQVFGFGRPEYDEWSSIFDVTEPVATYPVQPDNGQYLFDEWRVNGESEASDVGYVDLTDAQPLTRIDYSLNRETDDDQENLNLSDLRHLDKPDKYKFEVGGIRPDHSRNFKFKLSDIPEFTGSVSLVSYTDRNYTDLLMPAHSQGDGGFYLSGYWGDPSEGHNLTFDGYELSGLPSDPDEEIIINIRAGTDSTLAGILVLEFGKEL